MRNIIITGANEGIGFYMAEELLKAGERVAVLDISTDKIAALSNQYPDRLLVYKCDVSDEDSVINAVNNVKEQWGGIDIAVHNACLCLFTSLEETTKEDYQRVFNVNFFGAVNLLKAILPSMKARRSGKVCFASSGVGVTGFINISAYASSKGAIESLAKCLDIECRGYGISFHIIHPPLTRTASSKPLPMPQEMMADPQVVGRGLARNICKKRFVISHSFGQRILVRISYMFGIRMGRMMSKLMQRAGK